jgi:hypothetical protein
MIPDPDKFFRERYSAVVDTSNKTIRSYQRMNLNQVYDPNKMMNYPFDVTEEICYSVTIPISQYERLTKQLAELEEERIMRQRDSQLSQLYSEYKMWLNLKR